MDSVMWQKHINKTKAQQPKKRKPQTISSELTKHLKKYSHQFYSLDESSKPS